MEATKTELRANLRMVVDMICNYDMDVDIDISDLITAYNSMTKELETRRQSLRPQP